MADIDIERRTSPTWIWWILGLLLLGLLLFWVLGGLGRTSDPVAITDPIMEPAAEPMPVAPPAATPAAVSAYTDRCAPRQPGEMGLDHAHTGECIRLLASGLESVMPQTRRAEAQPHLQAARAAGQRLEESPADVANHATMVRQGFSSIAAAIQMAEGDVPGLSPSAHELNESAEAVREEQLLLDQRAEVQRFFARANEALERMAMR